MSAPDPHSTPGTEAISFAGLDPSPELERAAELLAPNVWVRMVARLRRTSLDRALIAGADPASGGLFAARALQLTSAACRARLAASLELLTVAAERPVRRTVGRRAPAHVLPSRAAVLANRAELLELARVLRDKVPLYARGLAIIELLVTDGSGPAYTDSRGDVLARYLRLSRAALAGA
jgi:hypothetical protein